MGLTVVALFSLILGIASAAEENNDENQITAEPRDAKSIALRAEECLRADRTYMRARVATRRGKKDAWVVEFESWIDRVESRAFLRVLSPESVAGEALLDLPPNLWRYEVEMERTQRILPTALLEPWMSSDFAVEDLLRPVRVGDGYEVTRLDEDALEGDSADRVVLRYTPRLAASADRRRVDVWIDVERGVPTRQEFYSASGELARTITFGDVHAVGDRLVPHRWASASAAEAGSESVLEIIEIRFEAAFDDRPFTTPNLQPAK
jgi:hypothetical protein